MSAVPHYVTLDDRQVRVWRAGSGSSLVVLPGLAVGAAVVASRLAALCPGWAITAIELPCDQVAAACEALGLEGSVVVAVDLAAALADDVAQRLKATATILVGSDTARAWAARLPSLASFRPRPDGAHLTTLFAHLRDLEMIEPANRSRPAHQGCAYLDPDERHASFLQWAADPVAYTQAWSHYAARVPAATTGLSCATIDDLPSLLATLAERPPVATPLPATRPTRSGIWMDYADIADGRVHLRRAGPPDKPLLLVFQSAPGSCAPLSSLIAGLSTHHHVIAADYLGNGDSAKPLRKVDIALLARDALQLAEALGLERFDLWGTHTGALIALEVALIAPHRVGRAVLEAPPLLSADFSQDILTNYLPPLVPDKWGLHLQQAWNMRRDMFLFWPWYRQQRDAVRPLGLPDDATLHDWTVGLLKSGRTYDLSYRAAFEYPTAQRLPLLTRPALICAGPADMLADGLARARAIAPAQVTVSPTPATVWYPNQATGTASETIAIYRAFLAGQA
jgi:pimeloyl-ACP methyl ester carboxylesterase